MRERVRQYGSAELAVDLESSSPLLEMPAAIEVAVYRIVEEALANVARHTQASRSVVRFVVGDLLQLTIEDNGVGIDRVAAAGVGLQSMRERAEEVGGTCRIEPRTDAGTRVIVLLPLGTEHPDGS